MQEIEIQVGQEDHPRGFGWLLWAFGHPLSPTEGALMGFICLEEHTRGTGEIQWFTEGVTYGSITGPKWFGPRQEERKISRDLRSAQGGLLQFKSW